MALNKTEREIAAALKNDTQAIADAGSAGDDARAAQWEHWTSNAAKLHADPKRPFGKEQINALLVAAGFNLSDKEDHVWGAARASDLRTLADAKVCSNWGAIKTAVDKHRKAPPEGRKVKQRRFALLSVARRYKNDDTAEDKVREACLVKAANTSWKAALNDVGATFIRKIAVARGETATKMIPNDADRKALQARIVEAITPIADEYKPDNAAETETETDDATVIRRWKKPDKPETAAPSNGDAPDIQAMITAAVTAALAAQQQ